jgi:hypothetical protein
MKSFRAFVVELEEKKLVGGQKELDHDKDGDIDGSDFAMMRKKNIKPSATQVKEDMNKTHTVEIDHDHKRDPDAKKHNISLKLHGSGPSRGAMASGKKKDLQKYLAIHYGGSEHAKDVHPEVHLQNEETDQLDELSPATLGNYVNKVNYEKDYTGYGKKRNQRKKGVKTAINKLVTKAGGDKNDVTNYGVPDHLK